MWGKMRSAVTTMSERRGQTMRRILIIVLILVSAISVLFNLLNYLQIHNLEKRVSHVEQKFEPQVIPIPPYYVLPRFAPAKPEGK